MIADNFWIILMTMFVQYSPVSDTWRDGLGAANGDRSVAWPNKALQTTRTYVAKIRVDRTFFVLGTVRICFVARV
jgi:hypothetical protein